MGLPVKSARRECSTPAKLRSLPFMTAWAILESGKARNLAEVAEMEGMDRAYLSRMVNLTTLAPDIVAAILDESLPDHVTLFDLASGTPLLWDEQRAILCL